MHRETQRFAVGGMGPTVVPLGYTLKESAAAERIEALSNTRLPSAEGSRLVFRAWWKTTVGLTGSVGIKSPFSFGTSRP